MDLRVVGGAHIGISVLDDGRPQASRCNHFPMAAGGVLIYKVQLMSLVLCRPCSHLDFLNWFEINLTLSVIIGFLNMMFNKGHQALLE